jgi:hypothetical protein
MQKILKIINMNKFSHQTANFYEKPDDTPCRLLQTKGGRGRDGNNLSK